MADDREERDSLTVAPAAALSLSAFGYPLRMINFDIFILTNNLLAFLCAYFCTCSLVISVLHLSYLLLKNNL